MISWGFMVRYNTPVYDSGLMLHSYIYIAYINMDNIYYYLFAWAHVIDATYVNRRVGAMQPYAEK